MIDIPKGIFSDGKLCPSLSISVAGESQKSLLCCYFLLCSNVSLGDHFLLFLSEMHLRAFNVCIQKTHSFALGEFLLPLVLVWHVVGTGNQIVISIQRLIISSMGNIIIYKVSEKDLWQSKKIFFKVLSLFTSLTCEQTVNSKDIFPFNSYIYCIHVTGRKTIISFVEIKFRFLCLVHTFFLVVVKRMDSFNFI